MKRSVCFALGLALLLCLSGCRQEKQTSTSPVPSQAASFAPTQSPSATPTPSPEAEEEPMFPRSFNFGSGSGGWGTEVTIAEDGSFVGYFQDVDLGAGEVFYCHFTGKFSAPEQVDDYTYSMRLESLEAEETEGEEQIDEYGVRWVASYAYGMEAGEEYLLYLPGTPVADLPESFVMWAAHGYDYGSWDGEALPGYGLYNVETEYGFSECQPQSVIDE